MFGSDGQDQNKTDNQAQPATDNTAVPADNVSQTGTVFAPANEPAAEATVAPQAAAPEITGPPPPASDQPVFAQPANVSNDAATSSPTPQPAEPPAPEPPTATGADGSDLLTIKQQALQSLTPLVDELQQSPEDKFKTMMMLIQASDNPELVKKAYAAANDISDEKARAQALLDIVNEINYFTQKTKEK